MPCRTTNNPMESILEAYAILLKHLTDSVYGLFTTLGYIMIYTTITGAFSIACLSATFYILVTSLIGLGSWQETHSENLRATAEVQSGLPDEAIAATMDKSLASIPKKSSNNIPPIRINGIDALPAELPPAIPPYLKDCEFYYNMVDMDLIENTSLCLRGDLQVARLTIGEQSLSNSPGYVKMVLGNLERGRRLKFNEREGVLERSESQRAKLELRERVYVGSAEWLLRVLEEEDARSDARVM